MDFIKIDLQSRIEWFFNQFVLIWGIGPVDGYQLGNGLNVNWIETLSSYNNSEIEIENGFLNEQI